MSNVYDFQSVTASNRFSFQLLQESIGIPGSNLNLIYRSSWATGYYSYLIIHLTQSDISPQLKVVHVAIEIEGSIYKHVLEADPNLKYTFTWDKRNVYKQKVGFFFARPILAFTNHIAARGKRARDQRFDE